MLDSACFECAIKSNDLKTAFTKMFCSIPEWARSLAHHLPRSQASTERFDD